MTNVEPLTIIRKYFEENSKSYKILVTHGQMVTGKALDLAEKVKHLNPDISFIAEAAMLHDIGIGQTYAPEIGCHGNSPYIQHGVLGREILEKEGLPKHALVCERHTGAGISLNDIARQNLPLPQRDMLPVSLEEQIICFADKFFSKNPDRLTKEKSVEKIKRKMSKFGPEKLQQVEKWIILFQI